jgi:ribulose-5-phosphate 4-epimerase/fuculose-1-phosphate aldolase
MGAGTTMTDVVTDIRTIARNELHTSAVLERFLTGVERMLTRSGYRTTDVDGSEPHVVLHVVDAEQPRPFRRKAAPTFVVAIAEVAAPDDRQELLRAGYPLLVRALANLCLLVTDTDDGLTVRFVTLEQGTYGVGPGLDDDAVFARTLERMEPLASSHLVIANDIRADLPEHLWDGDEQTRQMLEAGRALDTLDLLPAPFPLEEILPPRDQRHVQLLYGIGGLSYGNVSTRFRGSGVSALPSPGGPIFWMSASGVDKSKLESVGQDILMVKDFDDERGVIVLSVPPGIEPRRVSVDAIEHWMIYQAHPDVGAILHVHAWMEGIPATDVNYPCGTQELAVAVADLVAAEPDPAHAVIGLRNHGITCTGESLSEILDRVAPKVLRQVPMT